MDIVGDVFEEGVEVSLGKMVEDVSDLAPIGVDGIVLTGGWRM